MSDWQVGDLALCIDDGPRDWHTPKQTQALRQLCRGQIYTVSAIGRHSSYGGSIMLVGLSATHEQMGVGWHSIRFRKIRPSAIEHIEALKRLPVEVKEDA